MGKKKTSIFVGLYMIISIIIPNGIDKVTEEFFVATFGLPFTFLTIHMENKKFNLFESIFMGNMGTHFNLFGFVMNILCLALVLFGISYLFRKIRNKKNEYSGTN